MKRVKHASRCSVAYFFKNVFCLQALFCLQAVLASPPIVIDPLANDIRIDASTLEIRFAPSLGTAVLRADNKIEYTPNPGVTNAVDSLTYRVCRAGLISDCKDSEVTVYIGDTATTYVLADFYDVPTWASGAQPSYTFNLLANDRGADPGSLTIIFAPINGSVSLVAGQLQYQPNFNFSGVDSCLMSVLDGNGESVGFSVLIYVGQSPNAIVARDAAWFEITDVDGDGLSDHWETSYATGLGTFSPTGDADGDGDLDAEECLAGSNPNDPTSFFRITDMEFDPGLGCFLLSYGTGIGRTYRLEHSTGLPFLTTQTAISGFLGTGASADFSVPCSATVFRYYRLKVTF